MVTPVIIQVLFWLLIAMVLVSVATSFLHKDFTIAILTLILGPIFVRVVCEIVIVFFRINDNLAEIKQKTSHENA